MHFQYNKIQKITMANTKYYSEAVLKVDDTEDEPSMQHENVIAENNFRS